ncbi:Rho guanine nucleotide exchange factor 7 [Amphibalanus amphitrite]|uniref:Rho guanine nucleotide exchange factor 7 n=1 Tax=Amphibalanus amphitrite TaxID=1232801 RepID=A0A6A4VXE4_AMPAM|nr:Rho guanine nucleotide exchange factor 7 [Amphibalanus amphitrite]
MASDRPQLVQALYSFKATNNDELTFKKGDVITLTQCDDADWWEGTLGDTTGWFPANYVKECSAAESQQSAAPLELVSQQRVYRSLVLQDIIDSERAHISELQTLCKNFLQPLSRSDVLSAAEYRQLTGNLDEVLGEHGRLLAELELQAAVQQRPQRAGHVFLSRAADLKRVHTQYCAGHPRAVCVLDKHKDALNAFMESQGAHTPGIMVLTTGLSKVFRRLDKFPCMLQEYERHLEEGHPDRGDTQRSIHVYNEITTSCATIRRQKETELEILSGNIRRWEGEQMANMGEIIHMGSVAVGKEHSDRYFVLFRTTLVMLSVSPRMSAFIYEGKLPLSGISVTKLEDSSDHKNAFEIAGPMIERIVAECQSRDEQQAWVSQLLGQIQAARQSAFLPSQPQPIPHTSVSFLRHTPGSGRYESGVRAFVAAGPLALHQPVLEYVSVPYVRLTEHIGELLRRGVLNAGRLKRLLYGARSSGSESAGRRRSSVTCRRLSAVHVRRKVYRKRRGRRGGSVSSASSSGTLSPGVGSEQLRSLKRWVLEGEKSFERDRSEASPPPSRTDTFRVSEPALRSDSNPWDAPERTRSLCELPGRAGPLHAAVWGDSQSLPCVAGAAGASTICVPAPPIPLPDEIWLGIPCGDSQESQEPELRQYYPGSSDSTPSLAAGGGPRPPPLARPDPARAECEVPEAAREHDLPGNRWTGCSGAGSVLSPPQLRPFVNHYVHTVAVLDAPPAAPVAALPPRPAAKCTCDVQSANSADSGLADVSHHNASCPLRGGSTPRLRRSSRLSYPRLALLNAFWAGSQASLPAACRGAGRRDAREPGDDPPGGGAEGGGGGDEPQPSVRPRSASSGASFRSHMVAHWWMKTSVCPWELRRSEAVACKQYLSLRRYRPRFAGTPRATKASQTSLASQSSSNYSTRAFKASSDPPPDAEGDDQWVTMAEVELDDQAGHSAEGLLRHGRQPALHRVAARSAVPPAVPPPRRRPAATCRSACWAAAGGPAPCASPHRTWWRCRRPAEPPRRGSRSSPSSGRTSRASRGSRGWRGRSVFCYDAATVLESCAAAAVEPGLRDPGPAVGSGWTPGSVAGSGSELSPSRGPSPVAGQQRRGTTAFVPREDDPSWRVSPQGDWRNVGDQPADRSCGVTPQREASGEEPLDDVGSVEEDDNEMEEEMLMFLLKHGEQRAPPEEERRGDSPEDERVNPESPLESSGGSSGDDATLVEETAAQVAAGRRLEMYTRRLRDVLERTGLRSPPPQRHRPATRGRGRTAALALAPITPYPPHAYLPPPVSRSPETASRPAAVGPPAPRRPPSLGSSGGSSSGDEVRTSAGGYCGWRYQAAAPGPDTEDAAETSSPSEPASSTDDCAVPIVGAPFSGRPPAGPSAGPRRAPPLSAASRSSTGTDSRPPPLEQWRSASSGSEEAPAGPPPPPRPRPAVAPPPPPHHAPVSEVGVSSAPGPLRPWTAACLRPSPPLRPCLALGREDTNRKSSRNMVYKYKKRGDDRSYEDDATILRVIEAYCTSSQPRHTVNSCECTERPDSFPRDSWVTSLEKRGMSYSFNAKC